MEEVTSVVSENALENKIIEWLSAEFSAHSHLKVGIGDDAAVLDSLPGHPVVTTDAIVDGVHFSTDEHAPSRIGYKAIAVNLSDLAAMGATPICCVVTLVLPRHVEFEFVKELYRGMLVVADSFNVAIAGGDTNFSDGPLTLSVTAIGSVSSNGIWRCHGAEPGDQIWVSGDFGGSILGKHLDFKPRCDLVDPLSAYKVKAATDVSDGLAADLALITRSSNVGAKLDLDAIPISPAAWSLAEQSGQSALEHALYDGEDFELIVVLSEEPSGALKQNAELSASFTLVGSIEKQVRIIGLDSMGNEHHLEAEGYEHR